MTALLVHWKLLAVGALVVLLGVQTYRLRDEQAEHALLRGQVEAARKAAQVQAFQNMRNKERTDAEHEQSLQRLRVANGQLRERLRTRAATTPIVESTPTVSGEQEAITCYDRGVLDQALREALQRFGAGLAELADEGEALAADLRACRAWGAEVNSMPGAHQ